MVMDGRDSLGDNSHSARFRLQELNEAGRLVISESRQLGGYIKPVEELSDLNMMPGRTAGAVVVAALAVSTCVEA
eukprot:scaffold22390_cov128-Skeletonema_dohrnii-CCMP3373.AAC.1